MAKFNIPVIQKVFQKTGKPLITGEINEVEVKERGNISIIIDVEEGLMEVNEDWGACDWSEWKYDLPQLGHRDNWIARDEAEYMIDKVLYPFEEECMEELDAYLKVWLENSLYDMSAETLRFCNRYIERLGAHPDARLQKWAKQLEKHRTAFCGDNRTANRMQWWETL